MEQSLRIKGRIEGVCNEFYEPMMDRMGVRGRGYMGIYIWDTCNG